MGFTAPYRERVAFLVRVLPAVGAESCFAMKGGTAINLFVRDLPRLSVDVDLTYLSVNPREEALAEIDAALRRIAGRIRSELSGARVQIGALSDGPVTKLVARLGPSMVKVEVNSVLRGCVFGPTYRRVSPLVEEELGFVEMAIVSFPDLYAGKIVAAMDRQHPRDLFDVRELLKHEGIDERLRQAVVVYLISHNRPVAEVLANHFKDIAQEYEHGFVGMTRSPIALEELYAARDQLARSILLEMPHDHRAFLLSFERGEPDWSLLALPNIQDLPAVRWRQRNLDGLQPDARMRYLSDLERVLVQ